METRANYIVVGIFTVLSILAAFGFVYWTAGYGDRGETAPLRFRIPGSATGLGRGSAVLFNGVKVGDVQRVYLDPQNPRVAIADTIVVRWTPVTESTKADVGLAGLTGQASIEMTGGDPNEPNLLDIAEEKGEIAVMEATPSALANLLQATQNLMSRADAAVQQLEGLVSDARGPLAETLENVRKFTKTLGDNADNIDNFLNSMGELSQTVSNVSERLDATLEAAESLFNAVDRDKVSAIVNDVSEFTRQLSSVGDRLDGIAQGVDSAVASIGEFSAGANETLGKIDKIVGAIDPDKVGEIVGNFSEASTKIDQASEQIARISETVGNRQEDIDQFITDAKAIAERLNQASTRVDGILAKVDSLLGSDDANGLMADARETLNSFREVANTLNARLGSIMDNLARFSGPGLRDVEALVSDARRSINRIEQAVTALEQNPQRIITGGDGTIRRYDGRARH
ncbi:MlaD family protein [Chelativorans composti]|jgi:ABC-type transport system involved in resistance to organic solvents, periplasmic component|uniref:MlaD family protein n=1 Tax=Chelativorans composti TaxID=768533 RepID=A0ABW5DK98_9HYPH